MAWWAQRRIGGITGDVIGAIQQVTLVTILVGATIQ
jgi:cobalamin synthase